LSAPALLEVEGLTVTLHGKGAPTHPVRDLSLRVGAGEIVGLAGESGSGKTLTTLAISRLLPAVATCEAARLELDGHDLLAKSDRELRDFLGTRLANVFQDPMSSLNPARRIGPQMIEAVRAHRRLGRREALALAERRLGDMRMSEPRRRLRQHPHELSGGMRQRTMLAMGLMGEPKLLIADEPTTALDVTVQAQVLDLICEINRSFGTAVLLISHDIALLSEVCDRIVVMYGGTVVEDLPAERLLAAAVHPYTRALVDAVPDPAADRSRPLAAIGGAPPQPGRLGDGCPFAPRCPVAETRCEVERPPLERGGAGHRFACWVAARAGAGERSGLCSR
jgi:peptide/nickel transport system permease protein